MPITPDKPKRRWLRVSLRTFLVLVTVACLLFGGLANRANRQRHTVQWVTELGGRVSYDYEFDKDDRFVKFAKPPGPDWLNGLIGIDYFANVVTVDFTGTQELSDVSPLANLKSLEYLWIYGTQVSKEDCEMLEKSLSASIPSSN